MWALSQYQNSELVCLHLTYVISLFRHCMLAIKFIFVCRGFQGNVNYFHSYFGQSTRRIMLCCFVEGSN